LGRKGEVFDWILGFLKRDFEKLRGYFDTNRFDLKRAPRQGPVGHPFPQYPHIILNTPYNKVFHFSIPLSFSIPLII